MIRNLLHKYTINRIAPENYKEGELDFCKNEFSYETNDVKLVELNECEINSDGFVYTSMFKVERLSLVACYCYPEKFIWNYYFKNFFLHKKSKADPNTKYLVVFDEWSSGHYHWFCEVLPRLIMIKDKLKNYCLLLPNSDYIRRNGLLTLDILKLEPGKIRFINRGEILKIKKLSLVSATILPGRVNDDIIREIQEKFFEKLDITVPGYKKIYISRQKARFRKVLNEDKVIPIMSKFGYDIVYFEDLSLMEQIKLTSKCKSIVSIHGAGLTNAFFLPHGSSVLEFRRNKIYHNQCYWHLSSALCHKYYYLFGTPDNENLVIEGPGCNLTIDLDKLTEVLTKMEA